MHHHHHHHHFAGMLSLQSLQVDGNNIQHVLDVRILAALPHLQHVWLAGNPVMAYMNPREQRAFIVDLMPGATLSLLCLLLSDVEHSCGQQHIYIVP